MSILQPRQRLSGSPSLGSWRKLLSSRFVQGLTYPHSVDNYLELVSPLWSLDRIRAVVVDVVRETPDVVTLVLRPNENFPGFRAGQYAAITIEVDGTRHTRCFSFSSAPERSDGLVTLTVKARTTGGLVSPYLARNARRGLRVELAKPQGAFVLPEKLPERLLFISGGSGITPCMSMLRSLARAAYAGRIAFVHYARSPEDVIFREELRELDARLDNLELIIETESELGRLPGLDERSLSRIAPDYECWDCWVCGPQPLMNAACRLFEARGARERVRTEQFVLAPAAAAQQGEAGTLRFARSGSQVDGDDRTLLEQAEAAGLTPASGCRMGICQSCRCRKIGGTTRDLRSGELSSEDETDIQLCVSVPVGDVTLEL